MIKLRDVSKKLDNNLILDHINLEFEQGYIYSLIGPNGAGKTTIISILSGLMEIDSGNIAFDNEKDIFLLLSGERNLYYKNLVKDNIYYFGILNGLTKQDITNRLNQYLERYPELKTLLHKKVESISFGQKKIISTLIAILCDNHCIILDEVSEGLDVASKDIVIEMLFQIKKEKIIILVSHDFEFMSHCTDYGIYIFNGKVMSTIDNCTLDHLKSEYKEYVV